MKVQIPLVTLAVLICVAGTIGQQKVDVLVKDISVFDAASGTFAPHRDIVVSGTKITQILPAGSYRGGAKTVINGTGKFAIPGLFDNHVHAARLTEASAGIFLAYGITSVRDMGTEPAKIVDWRKRIAYGKFYGPRIVQACGPMFESSGEERKDHWVVAGPEDADKTVARVAAAGMDCIKLRTHKDEETYLAIAAAAKKYKLVLVGHAPEPLTPATALRAGQLTFEHAFYPYPLSKLTAEQKQSLFDEFKKAKAAVVPTFVAWEPFTRSAADIEQKLAKYKEGIQFNLPQELLDHWEKTIETHKKQNRGSQGWRDAIATAHKEIGEFHQAGITVLPGSDTGAPFVVPGLALHDELGLLVSEVGLTPAEALRSATLASATFYGRENELGSIETGKIADFIILTKDPLDNIANTREIDAVVFRGEALTRAHLNLFLSNTKAK
ncbi:MAG: amidohydrolase family protein [Chloracidobacterium sp.]|nr:amidohydrolase family protein [Chloracidobacterium sp.]